MDNSKAEKLIEKWRDGSIVDEWMNSKPSKKFYLFHPYLTYSDTNNDRFIKPDGTQSEELTANSEALFILGEKAFSRLPKAPLATDFDEGYASYFQFMDELRTTLLAIYNEGRFTLRNLRGKIFQPDFIKAENGWILNLAWNGLVKSHSTQDSDISNAYFEAFLFHVFYEIDNALVEMDLGDGAAAASISAAEALANAISIESGNENCKKLGAKLLCKVQSQNTLELMKNANKS